jgi:hypothetical protein
MSNNEAPIRIVRWIGQDHSVNYSDPGKWLPKFEEAAYYIREDLTLDAKLKEPGAIVVTKPKDDAEYSDYLSQLTASEMKVQCLKIIDRHLESITEARKDTTGLGMIQHIIKMILAEVNGL